MLASMAKQRASSSSACFTNSLKNQVFLSFRGEDTRHNFTDHLYNALCQRGINTFRDDDELRRGEEISRALLTAIEESKISVVVFSKNYASSKWCLDELVKILDCKESNQQLVIPVFYKVNPSDVRNQRGSFGDALVNMERRYKDKMDKVNKWRAALSQVAALSVFNLDEHQSESKFIQDIIEEISKHVLNTVCLEVAEHPVGMQAQEEVMNELLDLGESDVRMVGVWGTVELILRGKKLKVTNVDKGVTLIKEWLRRRKVLLVLDDVDDMEQLHKLVGACNWFGVGSRIIITTRDKQLLTAHDVNLIHEVKILHDPEALELLSWYAFKRSEPPLGDYVKLAERAIRYAQGLPLALKVLGSHLYGGSIHKWQAALDGFQGTEIQEVLKISYNALDDRVKKVFLDITCFFKGKSRNYVTEACELNTRYGIDVLIEKALISVEGSHIQMHDLLEKMGKDIIEQSRPLNPENGTNKITGIMLNFPKQDDEIFLDIAQHFENLAWLNLAGSQFLTEIPDLSSSPNLRLHKVGEFPKNCGKNKMESLYFLDLERTAIKKLPESIGCLIGLEEMRLSESAIKEFAFINWKSHCPRSFTNHFLWRFEPTQIVPRDGDFARRRRLDFEECNVSDIDSLENFCRWSNLKKISLSKSNFVCLPVCNSECVNLKELDLRGCKRLVEILVQLPASIKWVHMSDCISLERFSTMSKILEDGDMQGISYMDLSNCHRLCDNLGLDVSKMAKLFNEMKFRGNARIVFRLPGSSSKVPEWFTFRNYLDDYDESKFDNLDHDGRSVRNYELPIEIPSTLDNAKLSHRRDEWRVYGGETEAGNVWLECMSLVLRRGNIPFEPSTWDTFRGTSTWLDCIPLFLDDQLMPPIFRVTVSGKGLRVKSIGAHLVHNSMSRDYNVTAAALRGRRHSRTSLKAVSYLFLRTAHYPHISQISSLKFWMANLAKLEFAALDLSGDNFLSWVLDAKIHLRANGLGQTIVDENNASPEENAKAMIFLRRHIHEALKSEYVVVDEPLVLWKALGERYDHQKTMTLQELDTNGPT
ncbi:Disease resistance protein CC-NBS-LRR class family [Prunus dulcis]|uniref:Disease resistance protein CC-NBS-LRR class family n=1 Tax=Prunus dulcis TaxID=3755 RepID=A0A4Y1QNF4_PRUDU|nr:Disease resistance protein CC-NBS-LRR class family [Prunus dulcis]